MSSMETCEQDKLSLKGTYEKEVLFANSAWKI